MSSPSINDFLDCLWVTHYKKETINSTDQGIHFFTSSLYINLYGYRSATTGNSFFFSLSRVSCLWLVGGIISVVHRYPHKLFCYVCWFFKFNFHPSFLRINKFCLKKEVNLPLSYDLYYVMTLNIQFISFSFFMSSMRSLQAVAVIIFTLFQGIKNGYNHTLMSLLLK